MSNAPHDVLVNVFKERQIVHVQTARGDCFIAHVVKVTSGGLIAEGGMTVPGQLVLQIVLPIEVDPGRPVPGVVVLQQPKESVQ